MHIYSIGIDDDNFKDHAYFIFEQRVSVREIILGGPFTSVRMLGILFREMKSQPKMQQHKNNLDDKSSQIKINVLNKAISTLIKTCI